MIRLVHVTLLLPILLVSSWCQAQTLIDSYGFYRSWKELNDRYFAKQVQLDERGLEPGTDTRTSKLSEKGFYRISVEPNNTSISTAKISEPPFNQIHSWLVKIQLADGSSITGLELEFYGGMPLHNHGFPTTPTIVRASEPDLFWLNGVKFSMMGWWQFAFAIKTDEQIDTVRINLVIKP